MNEYSQNNADELNDSADEVVDQSSAAEQTSLERDDDRWQHQRRGWRDWWVLLLLIATYLVWTGLVYLLEPGIR